MEVKYLSDEVQNKVQSFADQIKHSIQSDTNNQNRNVTSTEKNSESRKTREKKADDKFTCEPEITLVKERFQRPKVSSSHPVPNVNEKSSSTPAKKTLLIGDSLFKGIKTRGLRDDTKVLTIRGAMTNRITYDFLMKYDFTDFKNVIVYVGGNDASAKSDLSTLHDDMATAIAYLKERYKGLNVYQCTVGPRGRCRCDTDQQSDSSTWRKISCSYHRGRQLFRIWRWQHG